MFCFKKKVIIKYSCPSLIHHSSLVFFFLAVFFFFFFVFRYLVVFGVQGLNESIKQNQQPAHWPLYIWVFNSIARSPTIFVGSSFVLTIFSPFRKYLPPFLFSSVLSVHCFTCQIYIHNHSLEKNFSIFLPFYFVFFFVWISFQFNCEIIEILLFWIHFFLLLKIMEGFYIAKESRSNQVIPSILLFSLVYPMIQCFIYFNFNCN